MTDGSDDYEDDLCAWLRTCACLHPKVLQPTIIKLEEAEVFSIDDLRLLHDAGRLEDVCKTMTALKIGAALGTGAAAAPADPAPMAQAAVAATFAFTAPAASAPLRAPRGPLRRVRRPRTGGDVDLGLAGTPFFPAAAPPVDLEAQRAVAVSAAAAWSATEDPWGAEARAAAEAAREAARACAAEAAMRAAQVAAAGRARVAQIAELVSSDTDEEIDTDEATDVGARAGGEEKMGDDGTCTKPRSSADVDCARTKWR